VDFEVEKHNCLNILLKNVFVEKVLAPLRLKKVQKILIIVAKLNKLVNWKNCLSKISNERLNKLWNWGKLLLFISPLLVVFP